ncbi:transposase IS4 family protein (plasmid) [Bradyrhizobium diazoefficiens]|nr:transposase IS4 family protein [Bradyrhizobium diazoefficiens]
MAVVLRPGKTPGGVEVRAHLRRLVRHIRTRWHNTQITFRGDGHYARPEAMAWCETNGIDYIFGLSGTKPLARKVDEVADDIRTRRAIENLPVLRGYTETRHKANPGIVNGALSPVLRRRCSASTSVSSSPASMSARPSGSTTACIARAAKPRI